MAAWRLRGAAWQLRRRHGHGLDVLDHFKMGMFMINIYIYICITYVYYYIYICTTKFDGKISIILTIKWVYVKLIYLGSWRWNKSTINHPSEIVLCKFTWIYHGKWSGWRERLQETIDVIPSSANAVFFRSLQPSLGTCGNENQCCQLLDMGPHWAIPSKCWDASYRMAALVEQVIRHDLPWFFLEPSGCHVMTCAKKSADGIFCTTNGHFSWRFRNAGQPTIHDPTIKQALATSK